MTARAVPMDAVADELTRADVVVSCTGATGLVLTAEAVAHAVEGRTGAPAADSGVPAVKPAPPQRPAGLAADENCPLDLAAVQPGFSLMGEAAVAGMDAATLEQHAAWVAGGAPARRERRTPEADAELITALAATAATVGRIPERRRPEPVAERPAPFFFLLDLAMPRDIDAAVHRLAGVRLVDIEVAGGGVRRRADGGRRGPGPAYRLRRGRGLRRGTAGGAHHADRGRPAHHGRRRRRQ